MSTYAYMHQNKALELEDIRSESGFIFYSDLAFKIYILLPVLELGHNILKLKLHLNCNYCSEKSDHNLNSQAPERSSCPDLQQKVKVRSDQT